MGGRLAIALGFLLVAALFVSMGRTSSSQHPTDADNALSGQAHHSTTSGLDHNVDRPGASVASYFDRDENDKPQFSYDSGNAGTSSSWGSHSDGGGDAGGQTHPSPPQTTDHGSSSSGSTVDESDDGGDDDGSSSSSGSDDGSSSSGSDDDGSSSSGSDDGGSSSSGSDDGSSGSDDDAASSASGDGESGSGNGSSSSHDSEVPGAAKSHDAPSDHLNVSSEDNKSADPDDASEAEKAELQVAHDLKQVELDEVAKEEAKVQSTVSKIGSGLRIGLGRLFGNKASTKEIEELAQAVETEVVAEMDRDIEAESTTALNKELEQLETEREEATSEGTSDHEIAEEFNFKRTEAIDEMRHSIQEIEERVEKSIEARTSMAEKKVLEEKLSKKLGKTVKLTFADDEEDQFGGLNEAIEELPSLRGTEADKKRKKKKKKKNNTELGGKPTDESTSRLDSQYGD